MFTHLSRAVLLVCLGACASTADHPTSAVRTALRGEAPVAAAPTSVPARAHADAPAPALPADEDTEAALQAALLTGRRYASDRTALTRIVVILCPDRTLRYHRRGTARTASFTYEGTSVHAHYEGATEEYRLSNDLQRLTVPGHLSLNYQGDFSCKEGADAPG